MVFFLNVLVLAGYVRPIIRHRKRVGQRLLDMLSEIKLLGGFEIELI